MKKLVIILVIFLTAGCASGPPRDTVTQTSTIDALLAGVYDGEMTCGRLLSHGDFGIGTFDRLDGEMVVLEGKVYQIKADGKVYQPPESMKTPFAAISEFHPDEMVTPKPGTDYAGLREMIDNEIENHHLFYGIRIDGHFKYMHTRSVPAQNKPYRPLAEVTKNQPEFKMTDISGTIVGFRCPSYVKGINVPGFHLHFLSKDKTSGGHILGFEISQAKVEIDTCSNFLLVMPKYNPDIAGLDLEQDRSRELEEVEK
jgi:acetolactate decarboxylase